VRERTDLRRQIDKRYGFESIIGRSPAMQRVFDVLGQISATNATVLIQGESGTGKELIARALHNNSPRRTRPFVALNCAALSEGILESELFGHEKGAFTGADQMRHGRFEYAQHGTLFLDEVGDMPMTTQIKLLRVIEQREIMRVGSNIPIPVDVRLLAATNQDLEALVREKRFREDLYFRLKVFPLQLPPLRRRREDIALLAAHFVEQMNRRLSRNLKGVSHATLQLMREYDWPGNVRELRNVIERGVLLAPGDQILPAHLPAELRRSADEPAPAGGSAVSLPTGGVSLAAVEKRLIEEALEKAGGNQVRAARMLEISRDTLRYRMKKFGLT
jgi:DNA-binding NtrC family response regulator